MQTQTAAVQAGHAIDTAAIERAQSTKNYIEQAHAGTTAAMVNGDVAPILSNPVDYLDKLANLSPSAEYFASSAIVGSLGYSVINQILFAFRKANAKAKIPEPTIDIFNGTFADKFEQRIDKEMSDDNGHATLPTLDAIPLTGVYMQMLFTQRAHPDFASRYPAKMPHEILHEMQTQDRASEIAEAYRQLDEAAIAASPAAHAILAEKNKAAKAITEFQAKQHQVEAEHVLKTLRDAMPEQLTDAAWAIIPLYIQYKLTVFVYKQAVKAVSQETLAKVRVDTKFDELLEIVNTLHLELEAAARTAEVRLAFAQERLDERHDISVKQVTVAAPASNLRRVPADPRTKLLSHQLATGQITQAEFDTATATKH